MSTVGLDIGTTGCKAIIFGDTGDILSQAAREYPILTPQPGWAEQDAELVWQSAWEALAQAAAQNPKDAPKAMALSVQGEAVIPVDRHDKPLRKAILGMDTRTVGENEWLAERFGAKALFDRTGMPLHTINTLPKLLWLQKHERPIYDGADKFLLYEDFFLRRLGGRAIISHCLASRTQMYDISAGDWARDILSECHIDADRLASLAAPDGGVVGKLRNELARELGLPNEVLLVSGGHDQACAALGSGVVKAGLTMVSTGTAEVVEVAMKSPAAQLLAPASAFPQGAVPRRGHPGRWPGLKMELLRRGNISVYRHVVPGMYLAMTLNHSGGLLLRWFRDTLCKWEREQARATGRDPYDLILADAPQGPTDLMVLPHFAGSGTPWLDTTSKGAILGLNFATSRQAIAKAILEGLSFELRVNLDLLRDAGIDIDRLHAVGGGARSGLWLQLKADICRVPLSKPCVTEAACLGAALLASVGAGTYPDLATASATAVKIERTVEPQDRSVAAYERRYHLYRQVYPTLIDLHRKL